MKVTAKVNIKLVSYYIKEKHCKLRQYESVPTDNHVLNLHKNRSAYLFKSQKYRQNLNVYEKLEKYTKMGYNLYTDMVLSLFGKARWLNMRLKELRCSRGISQLKLALELNMNQNSISRYENGIREADYQTLIAFADYFQVSLDYLLERTDRPEFIG